MKAVEFQTSVKNGTIVIPVELRGDLGEQVRVILLTTDPIRTDTNLIDRLLVQPLRVPAFHPMTREDVHVR